LTVEDRDGVVRISEVHGSAPTGADEVSVTSKELWLQLASGSTSKVGDARPNAASRSDGPLLAADRALAEGQRAATKLVDKLGTADRRLSWTSEVVTLETGGAPVHFQRLVAKLRADADAVEMSAEASAQSSTPISKISVKIPRTRGMLRASFELHDLDASAMIPASKLPAIEGAAQPASLGGRDALSFVHRDYALSLRAVATQGKVRIARVATEAFSVAGLGADLDLARAGGGLTVRKTWLRAGEVRVMLTGIADITAIPDSIRLSYEIPPVSCQALLDAIPKELLSQVNGMRASGASRLPVSYNTTSISPSESKQTTTRAAIAGITTYPKTCGKSDSNAILPIGSTFPTVAPRRRRQGPARRAGLPTTRSGDSCAWPSSRTKMGDSTSITASHTVTSRLPSSRI
jgi:hypothetical protein